MNTVLRDPLLAVARILLTLFLIVLGIAMLALLIMLAALPFPFVQNQIIELGLANGVSSWQFTGRLAVMMMFISIFLVSAFCFSLLLRRIIDTVSAGDPFIPINAQRLNFLAYLTVVLAISAMLQPFIAAWVNELLLQSDRHEIYNFSADGLLLALVLFILARVFRHGAAMRDDLEGTV